VVSQAGTTALAVSNGTVTLGSNNNRNTQGAVTVGDYAVTIGYSSNRNSVASTALTVGTRSIAIGNNNNYDSGGAIAKAQAVVNAGEFAFGPAASHGMVTYVLAAITTDGTTVELTTDGSTFIAIPPGKVFCFEALQTTWNRTDGAHQVCRFSSGVIKNSAGTVTLVKAPTVIASDGAESQIAFADDDANDRLAVTITGLAGKTIETRVIVTGTFLGV